MIFNSTKMLYYTTMIIGVMICVSSNNWMMMWSGLEISLMSFLGIMPSKNSLSSESMMKYFIIQGTSSAILIMGIMFMLMEIELSSYIMVVSIMLKIGMAPFHNWVLSVIDGLSYECVFVLLTMIKVPPLMILSYMNMTIWVTIIISLVVGATMGINQNSMRKMLGYSSIYNLGYLCACISEVSIWVIYMLIYSFMLIGIITYIKQMNVFYFNQVMINEFDLKLKISFWLMMLSFGGVPPMLGFINKLMLLELMVLNNQFLILLVMIISSLIVMFYYTRSAYMSIMMSSISMKWNFFSMNRSMLMILMLNITFLSLMIFSKSMY
uniref:NADH-ubiquinone oxidoreductase chain 2 n=1 Tax=Atkinsoniella zizhongi TaxID=2971512 RepID=A0A976U5V6_9HEMI|nr:NADH dehydrogenase subunit 2 [Atkinsoniella zizhongi]UVF28950.1 NADH dehydrogenase subunit 2 [Atkinsoniella zizhongi]